jgi:diaminohydroxyphosphoribosylaminopyrimidine deaminase/5-amino-6-(5-phosphoribosylamino)uracil reductase
MIHPLMQEALALAEMARLICSPNPAVGAVLVNAEGHIIGRGYTQIRGGPHAEIMALEDARKKGLDTHGATAYVTLEPCSHHGRTGPCCDALIKAGIGTVVASVQDPNPLVAGQGFARLVKAGVQVEIGQGESTSRELNIGFFKRMQTGRPWVRTKIAASLDGATALQNGKSQWITSESARQDGQKWRARACALLSGVQTVLADDPLLNVRYPGAIGQPQLVVLDSQLRTPLKARLFSVKRPILIVTCVSDASRHQPYADLGAKVMCMPGPDGRVDLEALLTELGRLEVNELHVEAGPTLNGVLTLGAHVDEYLFYIAPRLIGPGRPLATLPVLESLNDAHQLKWVGIDQVGPDLSLRARPFRIPPPPINEHLRKI